MFIEDDGLIIAVDHEPLSFLRRAGYAGTDEEERFELRHAEDTIRRAAANGVNLLRAHFYKGAGYALETAERERVHALSELCHQYGVKLQLYVQFGTIAYETMRAEQPNVLDWVQKHADGRPITLAYGYQSFRYYPCLNSPGYWDYLENILEDGLLHYAPDAIGLDNITTGQEPEVCHCSHCREAFVAFVKAKYPTDSETGRALCQERFGHTVLDHLLLPVWNAECGPEGLDEIRNPLMQEWLLFRMASTQRVVERLYRKIKSIRPDVLVEINAYKRSGENTAFIHGLYVPDLRHGLDVFWNECDPQPEMTAGGNLYHRIRSFKMARALDKWVFTTSQDARGFAESMAFCRGTVNGVEQLLNCAYKEHPEVQRYRAFRQKHTFFSAATVRYIALYESRESLCFSNISAWQANLQAQQMLLSRQLPFDLVYDLESSDAYPIVALPGMRNLSDEEIDRLLAFTEAGGTLLLTDGAGDCDLWGRRRRQGSLRQRLGLTGRGCRPVYRQAVGQGTVIWATRLENSWQPGPRDFAVGLDAWRPPQQADNIADLLRLTVSPPVDVDAAPHVFAEFTEDDRYMYLHLLNLRQDGTEPVRLSGGGFSQAILLDADRDTEVELVKTGDGYLVPALEVYSLVRLDKQSGGN